MAQSSEPPSTQDPAGPRDGRSWTWFLILICVIVIFSSLGSAALFEPDEGRNAEKAREILVLGDWVTPHQNFLPTLDKPMFFYWLVAVSFKLFGLSEWSARLPSALAALGCILLVYRFSRSRSGDREALWSCLILVTSVEFFLLSRIVIFDMTLTFFITLALVSFYDAVQAPDRKARTRHWLWMGAAMGAGTLAKGPIALVIPGIVVFFYLLVSRKWFLLARLNILLGIVTCAAIVIPWYLWVELRNPGYLRYFLWEENFIRYLTPHFGRTKSWYYFFLVLAVGFLPWSPILPALAKDLWKRRLSDANLLLILWVILPFAFFSASNSKLPHYILPIYPPLAMLTGQFIAAQTAAEERRSKVLYVPSVLIIGFILYLMIGAVWPILLAMPIRATVGQKLAPILVYGVAALVVLGVFIAGYLKDFWQHRRPAYVCTAIGCALFLILGGQIMAAASLNRSSKSLAEAIAPWIKPDDRLVLYDTYAEGMPYYLRTDRPMWLVQSPEKRNVMGSAYLAERRPPPAPGYGKVLYSFQEFAARWQKNQQSVKLLVKGNDFNRLRRQVGDPPPRLLMKFGNYWLVTNR